MLTASMLIFPAEANFAIIAASELEPRHKYLTVLDMQ